MGSKKSKFSPYFMVDIKSDFDFMPLTSTLHDFRIFGCFLLIMFSFTVLASDNHSLRFIVKEAVKVRLGLSILY